MKLFFFAHDAGGAQAIASLSLFAQKSGRETLLLGSGPALSIFSQRGLIASDATQLPLPELEKIIDKFAPSALIFGTSVGDTLDKKILRAARPRCPTVAVVDYWSNYRARFTEKDGTFAPADYMLAIDEEMRSQMAADGFDPSRIIVTGNPYFDDLRGAPDRSRMDPREILFLSQPLSDMREYTDFGFDEFSALRDLMDVSKEMGYSISIKLHPKEEPDKYDAYLDSRTRVSGKETLSEALLSAGIVVGMISPALIEAALSGITAISYQPRRFGADVPIRSRRRDRGSDPAASEPGGAPDPLRSNVLGITKRVADKEGLRSALEMPPINTEDARARFEKEWPPCASLRALAAIEQAAKLW